MNSLSWVTQVWLPIAFDSDTVLLLSLMSVSFHSVKPDSGFFIGKNILEFSFYSARAKYTEDNVVTKICMPEHFYASKFNASDDSTLAQENAPSSKHLKIIGIFWSNGISLGYRKDLLCGTILAFYQMDLNSLPPQN